MEEWIRCPHCGHKLMYLMEQGSGDSPVIEIKCSSCKKVSAIRFISKKPKLPPDEA